MNCAFAETFRFLIFYLEGLYLENKDFAFEFSHVVTYRHSNVDTAVHTATS